MTYDDVEKLAVGLPGVTVATKWRNRTYLVGGHGFAWQRPFSKADLERFGDDTPPAGEILAVRVDGLDAKDALLAMGLPGFFTIPHFDGYAGLLIALKKARAKDVRAAVVGGYEAVKAAPKTRRRRR